MALACAASLAAGQALPPESVIALVGARVYADPVAIPLDDAVVVATGRRITAVGARKDVPVPQGATTIAAAGLVVVAGFQNSHVHFTDDARWGNAASRPAAALEASLREMVTRYGFTTVVDLASDPDNTKALRRRVDSGEIRRCHRARSPTSAMRSAPAASSIAVDHGAGPYEPRRASSARACTSSGKPGSAAVHRPSSSW
jgi:predicted amidohydrolase YtcJ